MKLNFNKIMSLIDYLNELIDYSMGFPFYQRLNPLFDWIFNGFGLLLIGRSIFAPRLGPLVRDQIH